MIIYCAVRSRHDLHAHAFAKFAGLSGGIFAAERGITPPVCAEERAGSDKRFAGASSPGPFEKFSDVGYPGALWVDRTSLIDWQIIVDF
jgi:hypothetical protein